MSNATHHPTPVDPHDDFRFRNAAEAIYYKYHGIDTVTESNGTKPVSTSERIVRDRPKATVRSQACSIL